MGFSVVLERGLLDFIFGKAELEIGFMYLGLWKGDIEGDSEELPDAAGYARVVTIPSDWGDASEGILANVTELAFPTATVDWETAIYVMLCNSPIWGEGTWYMYGVLPEAWTITTGNNGSFAIGELSISLD